MSKLTSQSGHFSSEPVAGELIRKAIDIGYQLIPYEDTAANQHTPNQRDSIQAANIFKIIRHGILTAQDIGTCGLWTYR